MILDASTRTSTSPAGPSSVRAEMDSDHAHAGYSAARHSADSIAVLDVVADSGVCELVSGNSGNVAAAVVEDARRAVLAVSALDQIPDRTRHPVPAQPNVSHRSNRPHTGRCG